MRELLNGRGKVLNLTYSYLKLQNNSYVIYLSLILKSVRWRCDHEAKLRYRPIRTSKVMFVNSIGTLISSRLVD